MKPSQQNPPQKEIYRLWYDYLKESPDFIQACKDVLFFEKKIRKKIGTQYWEPVTAEGRSFSKAKLLDGVYKFGNIHVLDFEKWWVWKKKQLARIEREKSTLVEDYSQAAGIDIGEILTEFRELTGRDPDLYEFLSHYKSRLESNEGVTLYLKLNLQADPESLKKAIGKMTRDKKGDPIIKRNLHFSNRWIYPTGRIYPDELERYLRIRRKFREMNWRGIADSEEIYRHRGYDDPRAFSDPKFKGKKCYDKEESGINSVKPAIFSDAKNAAKIIKNAEGGIFPGAYSRVV